MPRSLLTIWSIVILLSFAPYGNARSQSAQEHALKAVYIYKIAKFVSWPSEPDRGEPDRGEPDQGPLALCVLGTDPFGHSLTAVEGRQIHGRTVVIHHIDAIPHTTHCAILFLGASEQLHIDSLLGQLAENAVLTVGDTERYGEAGVMINLIVRKRRLRFEINLTALRQAGLNISSKLLELAVEIY